MRQKWKKRKHKDNYTLNKSWNFFSYNNKISISNLLICVRANCPIVWNFLGIIKQRETKSFFQDRGMKSRVRAVPSPPPPPPSRDCTALGMYFCFGNLVDTYTSFSRFDALNTKKNRRGGENTVKNTEERVFADRYTDFKVAEERSVWCSLPAPVNLPPHTPRASLFRPPFPLFLYMFY